MKTVHSPSQLMINSLPRLVLFFVMLVVMSACQPTPAAPPEPLNPPIILSELSKEQNSYYKQGMIILVDDQLTKPALPENPSQLEIGRQVYYLVCVACHGNWGQGLSDEWRELGFGEDMDCWRSKCHASNHPPQGFEFPKLVPPLLGPGSMRTLPDAASLYQIVQQTMPWWDPGSLTEEETLGLTAYLMEARGELPEGAQLTRANLNAFQLHQGTVELVNETPLVMAIGAGLTIAFLAYLLGGKTQEKEDTQE